MDDRRGVSHYAGQAKARDGPIDVELRRDLADKIQTDALFGNETLAKAFRKTLQQRKGIAIAVEVSGVRKHKRRRRWRSQPCEGIEDVRIVAIGDDV